MLKELQRLLVDEVKQIHERKPLTVPYDPSKPISQWVSVLLERARERGVESTVAQYLVGAKLQVRFPGIKIRNEKVSTADQPSGYAGDFEVSDSVFHITVSAPSEGLYQKCERNLQNGRRVYILVPDRRFSAARQGAEDRLGERVTVRSIENFIAQNIEEISEYASDKMKDGLRHLLEIYGHRVREIESDELAQIEIPENI